MNIIILPTKAKWKGYTWPTKFAVISGYAAIILSLIFFIIPLFFPTSINKKDLEPLAKQTDIKNLSSEIKDLKTEFVDPYSQPIQTANATVYIIFKSNEESNSYHRDEGGYLAFVKGNNDIILLSDQECHSSSITPEMVKYEGVFNLDANHACIGKKLGFLKEAEYLRIQFLPIDKDYEVIGGKVICIFNGNARIEFNIPKQLMQNKLIFVRNLSDSLNKVFKNSNVQ